MSKKTFPVNENQYQSAKIKHVRFDSHFTSTWNRTPEDPNLSWGAKGLLWYLLTREPGWSARLHHLSTVFKGSGRGNGFDSVKKMMKELRDNDYVQYIKSKNEDGTWDHSYIVYPMKIAQFQIMFPEVVKPLVAEPLVVKPPLIISNELPNNELEISKDISSSLKVSDPPAKAVVPAKAVEAKKHRRTIRIEEHAPEVIETQEAMTSALQAVKPDYKTNPQKIVAIQHEIDLMIRLDGRAPKKILDVFRWAVNDSFWQDKMFKPNPAKYLREKFDQLEMKMMAKPAKNPYEVDRRLRDENGETEDFKDRLGF